MYLAKGVGLSYNQLKVLSDGIIMMHGMKVISHLLNGNETVGSQKECEKMVYDYRNREYNDWSFYLELVAPMGR